MKSLYLLCEYDVSLNIVEMLEKNSINFDDILHNSCKLNSILYKDPEKINKLLEIAQKIECIDKEYSVYDLIKYGLSKDIIEKLYIKDIEITEINVQILAKNGITPSSVRKIMSAYKEWLKAVGIQIPLNEAIIKEAIRNNFGHKIFGFEEIKNILLEECYDCSNLLPMLESINLIKKDGTYFYPFDIYDLLDYGLSNINIKFLIENNITLEDINEDIYVKHNMPAYKFNQVMKAYDKFVTTNNYIQPIKSLTLLKSLMEKFKFNSYSKDEVYELYLEQDKNHIDKLLEELLILGKIKQNYDIYLNVFPKITEKIEIITDKKRYDIVCKKLSGMTLEQIGQEYGLTRERIRQIFSREFSKIKYVDEDKYAEVFKKYKFDEKLFCSFYNENKYTYNYLNERYQSGELEIYEMLELEDLSQEQTEMIMKKYNLIQYNGEKIVATKVSLLVAILKEKECKLVCDEIIDIYNEFVTNNNIELDTISKKDYHNIDSALEHNQFVLNSFGHAYRYYNLKNLDNDDIEELRNLFEIESGVYSAELFFNDNQLLMRKLDIRDEYELHNLFRKVFGNFSEKIIYGRMPDIYIDCNDKFSFIEEKIQELSPITLDEFADYIYQNYGHKVNTMKSYVVTNFNKYLNTKENITNIITDCPVFTDEQYQIMKDFLKEDIYSNMTIKQILTDEFDVNDFKLLNNMNFGKLGYKVRGNYIMKNSIGNLESYMRERILNQDYYEITSEMKKIGSTYTSYIYKFIYDKSLFKIDEDRYITISKLNKMGIYKDDIDEFIENIKKIIPENKYFNLYVLSVDFKSKLFEFDFPECLFENIIMLIDDIKMFKVKGNSIFIKTTENVNREKFINSFIKKNKTYLSEIRNQIREEFNIDLQESFIKDFVNKNKYYLQLNTNCVYLSKEIYENEVNQWDILKYID